MPIQFVRIFSVLEERLERVGIKMLQMRYIPQSKDAQLSPAFGTMFLILWQLQGVEKCVK